MSDKIGLSTFGLFAGIGGIELGLERAGHRTIGLCENDRSAQEVLRERFPSVPLSADVRELKRLPDETELVTAGFPCQDLSQAGRTQGIEGTQSGLIGEVFRLLKKQRVPWLLLENVPFMLKLGGGAALDLIISALEDLSYKWAYRVVDTRAFGLPQRRQRVFLLASLTSDPRRVLFADEAGDPPPRSSAGVACGFYWTEGNRGLGWAIDAVPTLKGGSALGIPSPPAVVLPSGEIIKPSLLDAERLQGFPVNWTEPATHVGRATLRWKLIGNAVTVDVAEWIGVRLLNPGPPVAAEEVPLHHERAWPNCAYNVGNGRRSIALSEWPFHRPSQPLEKFLDSEHRTLLSYRATAGFLSRFEASSLTRPPGFVDTLRSHAARMQRQNQVAREDREEVAQVG